MNINTELNRLDQLIRQAQAIRDNVATAAANTTEILKACDALGVDVVGIGKRADELRDSKGHPFGSGGSVFADGQKDGWPVAWSVARLSGLSSGCGNTGQHQISGPTLDGVYRCKDGEWIKMEATS